MFFKRTKKEKAPPKILLSEEETQSIVDMQQTESVNKDVMAEREKIHKQQIAGFNKAQKELEKIGTIDKKSREYREFLRNKKKK